MDFIEESNRIYAKDSSGKLLAEITFPKTAENIISIDHTFVDQSLRGQGIANHLMTLVVNKAKDKNWKISAVCSYAKNWFKNHPDEAKEIQEKKSNHLV